MYYLAIPKDRIAVLIGSDGSTKRRLEKRTGTKIEVNHEGQVTVDGGDSLTSLKVRDLVKAIGRGFSPERAQRLLQEDIAFDVIELGGNTQDKERVRGRVIGKDGKTRNYLERMLNCDISVFRDTVSIIGPEDKIGTCREAIEMIISGAMHTSVYKFIERITQNE
jgi:ribosomal RNA assembly protein